MAAAGTLAAGTGVLAAALFAPAAASASSSQTWTAGGDGSSWSDAMNWASHSVPQNGDSVTIPAVRFPARTVVNGMPAGTQLQDLTMTDASLSGGDVTVAGNFSWNVSQGFEVLASTLTVAGDASFSGAGQADVQDPMTFEGTTEFNGPGLISIQDAGPAITNDGVLTVAPNAVLGGSVCCVNPDVFRNNGTVSMTSVGTGNLATMEFNDQGSVVVAPGSLLDITGGPGEFGAAASVTGGGTLQFEKGASMTLATGISIGAGSTVTLTGNAQLFGPGSFVGGGKFSWTGGTISGKLNVASSITSSISGTATKTLTSPTSTLTALTLHGVTTVSGSGEVELSGTTRLSNLGAMTLNTGTTVGASVCCVAPDTFLNAGTLIVAAGTGTATTTNLQFSNIGTVRVSSGTLAINTLGYKQTGGATQMAGGAVTAAKQMNINKGTLSGFGTITGSVLNGGTVAPSTTGGVLKITGAYNQTSAGTLSSVITGTTPGTKFGQLNVGGKATLAGTLKVNTGNGFVPGHGQSFSVLLYHTRSGMFGTLSGSPPYTVNYTATAANVVYP
ncbi:MAG TPA: hypothetical protein VFJ07_22300 [Streptosporangiaceae bacterium]|nr:hypothetical protein [Streptosporangiaceae bacterium]